MVEKGVLVAASVIVGAVFAGFVGYKVLKKKKPEVLDKARKSMSDIKDKSSEMIQGAKRSFREGYGSVQASSAA